MFLQNLTGTLKGTRKGTYLGTWTLKTLEGSIGVWVRWLWEVEGLWFSISGFRVETVS